MILDIRKETLWRMMKWKSNPNMWTTLQSYSEFKEEDKIDHLCNNIFKMWSDWLFVSFVSVWPCDGLATCPGCTPPLAQ